ncbi:MAG TPA: sulfotransferase domain-containing protein [Anaerolineales bacterium]|nr:sulfotransferase domain-containing protein [Anaerolineales bacterium]
MIILSIGMPRAGSGWYYNLMHDLVTASGGQNARQIRSQFHLQSILTEVNCNIGALSLRRLSAVMIPSTLGKTFVIKAHAGPTPFARRLIDHRQMKAAYIYRDPRDALLSAYDNGQRAIQKGRPNAFSHLVDFDAALEFMREYVRISEAWLNLPGVLHTSYEDLVENYDLEATRLAKFLECSLESADIQAVIEQYRPGQGRQDQKGLHFNKGVRGRFREKLTPDQQATLANAFGGYLQRLSYPI